MKHFAARLFAVVDNAAAAPRPHRMNLAELREAAKPEQDTKHAVDRTNAVLDALEAQRASYKAQIAELARRDQRAAGRIEKIEDESIRRMEAQGLKRADGFHHQFEISPKPPAVEIDDEALIPAIFLRKIPPVAASTAPAKAAIKAAIESGVDVPGCHLTQGVKLKRQ
jgi:hypothetical protein